MKKNYLFLMLILFGCLGTKISAQVVEGEKNLRTKTADTLDGWKSGGVFGISFAQTSLTNWAAGGENSLALNGFFSVHANYKKNKSVWDNSLDMGYGILRQGKDIKFKKTDDKIDLISKFGQEAFKNFYYAALFNFKTQMTPGYNYPNDSVKISDWFAPAYALVALGLDYKPNAYLSMFVAPLTGKLTIVNNQMMADAGAFGVDKATYDGSGNLLTHGKLMKSEIGGYVRFIYSRSKFESEFLKNVAFTTKVDVFSNYLKNPDRIDVNWETLIAIKVNKYINLNINTQLIYDDDIDIAVDKNKDGIIEAKGPRVQFKEILGVGFSYKF